MASVKAQREELDATLTEQSRVKQNPDRQPKSALSLPLSCVPAGVRWEEGVTFFSIIDSRRNGDLGDPW